MGWVAASGVLALLMVAGIVLWLGNPLFAGGHHRAFTALVCRCLVWPSRSAQPPGAGGGGGQRHRFVFDNGPPTWW